MFGFQSLFGRIVSFNTRSPPNILFHRCNFQVIIWIRDWCVTTDKQETAAEPPAHGSPSLGRLSARCCCTQFLTSARRFPISASCCCIPRQNSQRRWAQSALRCSCGASRPAACHIHLAKGDREATAKQREEAGNRNHWRFASPLDFFLLWLLINMHK